MIIVHTFRRKKDDISKKKVLRTTSEQKFSELSNLSGQIRRERKLNKDLMRKKGFVKCVLKLCKFLRRFLQFK